MNWPKFTQEEWDEYDRLGLDKDVEAGDIDDYEFTVEELIDEALEMAKDPESQAPMDFFMTEKSDVLVTLNKKDYVFSFFSDDIKVSGNQKVIGWDKSKISLAIYLACRKGCSVQVTRSLHEKLTNNKDISDPDLIEIDIGKALDSDILIPETDYETMAANLALDLVRHGTKPNIPIARKYIDMYFRKNDWRQYYRDMTLNDAAYTLLPS